MRPPRRLVRLLLLIPHIARGVWQAATRLPRVPPPRTEAEWSTVRNWHQRALEITGVEVHVHGSAVQGPVLFVSNHVSWLDISALSTVVDAGFIGKKELERWPVLGFLISRGGTIYIERGGRDAATRAATEMARRLQRGERVAVFPEGTTSRGTDVRRFHPRLFEAARAAGVPIQPVAVVYDSRHAPFVDRDTFLGHLWRILGEPHMRVDVHLLPPMSAAGLDRRTLARQAEHAVRRVVHGLPAAAAVEGAEA